MLTKGQYEIFPQKYHETKGGVGILSLCGSKTKNVKTTGLEWDYNNDITLEMGSFQGSSNEILGDEFYISTDALVTFSIQFKTAELH